MGIGSGVCERETCWARSVEVTEKVTVTEREKLNGVMETCTRHIETREVETMECEVKETKDEHTHGVSEGP